MASPGDFPNSGIKLASPALQVNSLPAEPPRKPKNTGVGSLSLLQGIFPTQESNWGLLHCRRILYQLSYEGPYNKRKSTRERMRGKQTFIFFLLLIDLNNMCLK